MTELPSKEQFSAIRHGFNANPSRSMSQHADAYTEMGWFNVDLTAITAKTWQWVCHVEKLRVPGSVTTAQIAGHPIAIVRDGDGTLRAFYNVCKHRAHMLLSGDGTTSRIMCPYYASVYRLNGELVRAPEPENLEDFTPRDICLDEVQVEQFCGFVYVNLDPAAASLSSQTDDLETEFRQWPRDIEDLTFGHRLTYEITSNWKNVVDNFLECYVNHPDGSGKSEHAVHHFHGLVLDAYAKAAPQ